ncbi:MAG: MgtC/SapB family protein, partial [Mesorhizobium sp.]
VAFLAAGSILFSKGEIHGLTTGAGMWLSGAIGVACGLGLWQVAALGTLLVLVVAGLLYSFAARSGIGENTGPGKPKSEEDVSKPPKA